MIACTHFMMATNKWYHRIINWKKSIQIHVSLHVFNCFNNFNNVKIYLHIYIEIWIMLWTDEYIIYHYENL